MTSQVRRIYRVHQGGVASVITSWDCSFSGESESMCLLFNDHRFKRESFGGVAPSEVRKTTGKGQNPVHDMGGGLKHVEYIIRYTRNSGWPEVRIEDDIHSSQDLERGQDNPSKCANVRSICAM